MMYVEIEDMAKAMNLETVYFPEEHQPLRLYTAEVARPGLQMAGYFDWFSCERIQIFGKTEMYYMQTLDKEVERERLEKYFSFPIPGVIVAHGMDIDDEFMKYAKKYNKPVYRTAQKTTRLVNDIINYLDDKLAPEITVHGVCMEVFGVGILIRGKSCIGKSEAALELIKRGHRLVADDAVIVRKIDNRLKGSCPELTKHLLEIRGIGILDIKHLYGVGSIKIDQLLSFSIDLEEWDNSVEYDRLGVDENYTDILGVNLPRIVVPVRPGRNIATIIEVAAKNYRQKLLGYNTLDLYNQRFNSLMHD